MKIKKYQQSSSEDLLIWSAFGLFLFLMSANTISACPTVDGLVDFNCNEKIKISVIGDSVVAGIGDTRNAHSGGYVKRLNAKLPTAVKVVNIGYSGIRSDQMFRRIKEGQYRKQIKKSDIVLVDIGRNDCRDYFPTLRSVRAIKRLVRVVRKKFGNATFGDPFVVVATQIPDRERRRACLEALNRGLLARVSKKLPAYLRFDTLPDSILSGDGLHPTSKGYAKMARFAKRFISGSLQKRLRAERDDSDSDGIFDYFEESRFETDSSESDTDQDGLTDGEEIFTYGTNPLAQDSDDDGRSDAQEVSDGSDPLTVD